MAREQGVKRCLAKMRLLKVTVKHVRAGSAGLSGEGKAVCGRMSLVCVCAL